MECSRVLLVNKLQQLCLYSGGSRISRWGAWTLEAVTFRKFCMSKRKNLDPWGDVRRARPPPLDPPMLYISNFYLLNQSPDNIEGLALGESSPSRTDFFPETKLEASFSAVSRLAVLALTHLSKVLKGIYLLSVSSMVLKLLWSWKNWMKWSWNEWDSPFCFLSGILPSIFRQWSWKESLELLFILLSIAKTDLETFLHNTCMSPNLVLAGCPTMISLGVLVSTTWKIWTFLCCSINVMLPWFISFPLS